MGSPAPEPPLPTLDTLMPLLPTARGPLMLSPRLRPRLMLTTDTTATPTDTGPTVTDMDTPTDTDTTDTPMDTGPTDTDMDTPTDTDTTARGPLMPSPRLRLR